MKKTIVAVGILAAVGACGLIRASFKADATIAAEFNNKSGGGCENGAIFEYKFKREDIVKANGIPGNVCLDELNELRFKVEDDLAISASTIAGDTCGTKIAGTLTFTSVEVEVGGAKQTITCAGTAAMNEPEVKVAVGKCLDGLKDDANLREFVRKALNKGDSSFSAKVNGTCSADSCFHIKARSRVDAAGVAQGGGCD